LLQHARNPVDWWPWCEGALAESKRRDVPILLSIGYSACHWCHVMERESFEDAGVAKLMNELYVPIKVDREERPDLDQAYQLAVFACARAPGPRDAPAAPSLRRHARRLRAASEIPEHDAARGADAPRRIRRRRQRQGLGAPPARGDAARRDLGSSRRWFSSL